MPMRRSPICSRCGPSGVVPGQVGVGVGAAVHRESDRSPGRRCGEGPVGLKYALGLELTDAGFDASVLSEFRARLVTDQRADRVLELRLERLRAAGLLAAGGRQRTDATCVLAAIRTLNRLELVVESLRAALEALAVCAPGWLAATAADSWFERYAQRASDYRLPKTHTARDAYAMQVAWDGYRLLEAVLADQAPPWLRYVPAVQVLRRVWVQRYYRDQQQVRWRGKGELPSSAALIVSPYDTDARYGIKRGVGWEGYKAHLTETCAPDRPHLIVHAATTTATAMDVDTLPGIHTDLHRRQMLPAEHFVDAGYVSVEKIMRARHQHGIDLVGPLPPDSGWQARDAEAFDITCLQIDWDQPRVAQRHLRPGGTARAAAPPSRRSSPAAALPRPRVR
jgi:hypothetical protein